MPPEHAHVTIAPGSPADYASLARFHYLAGAPSRPDRVLAARSAEAGAPIGVLVVSRPTLNGRVRELAWPGRYRTGDKRADARRVNEEVRVISRVVVDPRWRGLGVARRLVRAYLADPLTAATEAIAAMGWLCPFFERAGMVVYELPIVARDARLIDALGHAGLEAHHLIDLEVARRVASHAWLARELRLWANGSRGTRRLMDGPIEALAAAAGAHACVRPVGYASSCA